jgi:adenine deaminase
MTFIDVQKPEPPEDINFGAIAGAKLQAVMRAMPKAELHMHIEGSLEPELMFELAQRNRVSLPYPSVQAVREAYAFDDLQSFLDLYYAGASVLVTEEDFFALGQAYCERALADGVVHSEVFVDPQTHTMRGIDVGVVFRGLERAGQWAAQRGLQMKLIVCFLRHLTEEDAFATLQACLPWREHFIGFGLDSSEQGHPPEKFSRVFARCRELGVMVVAHAGEEGPAAYVSTALDDLQVARVDHGVRSIDDTALMERLARERIPLTVCPLSNLKLCVVDQLSNHPLKHMLDAGLAVMINSDDPAYFGGYLLENYMQTQAALQLDARDVWQLAANAFSASYLTAQQRAGYMAQLNDCFRKALR